jgi:hypothetical protein
MHKPQNLDSTSALALLQEEALLGPNMYNKKGEGSSYYKKVYSEQSKQFSFSPSNTPRFPSSPTEEKKSPETVKNKNMKDMLTTLKNYRRAKGLCYKCGEKWHKGHQCQNVSLQAMEEVWSFVSDDSPTLPVHEAHDVDSNSSDELCEISVEAMQGIDHHATMRLRGFIADQEVYMLIDSGSSHCFISEACAARILGHQQLQETVQVKVANGQYIQCSHEIPNQLWHIQGVTFTSYDVIVGMDWLSVNSPMNMHWGEKWIILDNSGVPKKIQGITPKLQVGPPIDPTQLAAIIHQDSHIFCVELNQLQQSEASSQQIPPEIQDLVDKYNSIFQPIPGLPPARPGDHTTRFFTF